MRVTPCGVVVKQFWREPQGERIRIARVPDGLIYPLRRCPSNA
jgi:hypothetical protein